MAFHLDSDAVSLIALIVPLVALLIAFLQVIQQYAATASDYRRCSARTMGGWAKYTKRVFIPSEVRFEITFSVPHIKLGELAEWERCTRERFETAVSPKSVSLLKLSSDLGLYMISGAHHELQGPNASQSFLRYACNISLPLNCDVWITL